MSAVMDIGGMALYAAVVGVGAELANPGYVRQGRLFLVSVVAFTALKALECFFGPVTAVMTAIFAAGRFVVFAVDDDLNSPNIVVQTIGFAILGGAYGYALQP